MISNQHGLPQHTEIPNSIIDNAALFTHEELLVLLYICRWVFGRYVDEAVEERTASFDQLLDDDAGCGVTDRDILADTLSSLESKGWLVSGIRKDGSTTYRPNLRWSNNVGYESVAKRDAVPPTSRSGYVYVLYGEGTGYCKIGRTRNLSNRLADLAIQLPFRIDRIHTIACEDMVAAEAELHRRFAHKRANGEWFNLDSEDIALIRGVESMPLEIPW